MLAFKEKLVFQPPHKLDAKEKKFLGELPPKKKELHALASQMLGSSHFEGKTPDFTKWMKEQANPNKPSPATK